jgi:hypothetical protein
MKDLSTFSHEIEHDIPHFETGDHDCSPICKVDCIQQDINYAFNFNASISAYVKGT